MGGSGGRRNPRIRKKTIPVLEQRIRRRRRTWRPRSNWVLTRLHLRYTSDELKDDLVFQQAESIVGGRGTPTGEDGTFSEQGAKKSRVNQFQARYAILHPWEGEIDCKNPVRGRWGGPPRGRRGGQAQAAQRTAFVERGKIQLASLITSKEVPGLKIEGTGGEAASSDVVDESPDAGGAVAGADAGGPIIVATDDPSPDEADDEASDSQTTGGTSNETTTGPSEKKDSSSDGKCSTLPVEPSPPGGAVLALLALVATIWRRRP
jgi:hypothetical protein